jgi:hypothetical protein
MQNMTITMEADIARWARVWAARHNTSVSRMLGDLLAEKMREEDAYAVSMQAFMQGERSANFGLPAEGLESTAHRFGNRDDWHAR